MAQMNYPHAPDGCQPGERLVFNALKRYLPDDYFVWFEPTLFGREQSARPDFVVLGHNIGLVIIEVKDWSLDYIHSANRDHFELVNGSTTETRTNPQQQVERHFRMLNQQLERYRRTDPDKYESLLQTNGRYQGKLAVPISTMVAFPHINRSDWAASELQLPQMVNEATLLLRDDLVETLPMALKRIVIFPTHLSTEQLDTLKWMLYPETRIPYTQGRLFTLDAEQIGIAQIDTYLPDHAQLLTRKPQAKLIRGVVGSGKTLILLFRAKFISEQNLNWRVLVLTYNTSLREYLTQIFSRIGGDPARVEIVNFHKWCRALLVEHGLFRQPQSETSQRGLITRLLREAEITDFEPTFLVEEFNWIKERLDYREWPNYPNPQAVKRTGRGRRLGGNEQEKRGIIFELFTRYQEHLARHKLCDWADLPVMVLQAMDDGHIDRARYHAVLIDEAQDFAPAWFRVAFRMVKPETAMVFIAGDGAQKIYGRDFTWKELGLGITAQNSYVLQRSYRSTREIIDVALEAIRDSQTLAADLKSAGDGLLEPEQNYDEFRHGPLPILLSFASPEQEATGIAGEILSLLQQGYLPKDIVILQRRRSNIDTLARQLEYRGIACTVIKGQLDIDRPTVKICTFHSAKGLEFEVVFICGLDAFTVDDPVAVDSREFQELLDQERKLLYVGMTRARRLLYISYSGVAPDWIAGRLEQKLQSLQPR
ncbi:MAG: NERD domain-containing protein [Anaerolineae bacterium]|nr:NERD domain-containing protein [Anaerolineae bacterium]